MADNIIVQAKAERNSSIELLRILAACAVIVLHYNGLGGALGASSGVSKEVLAVLECLCVCAVDLFMMLSGYFLISNNRRTWDKPVYLLLQLSIISVAAYITSSCISRQGGVNIVTLAHLVIPPHNYFVLLYIVTYIVSPYINVVMKSLGKKGLNLFVIILLILFSFYPTLIDSYQIVMQHEYMGISPVGAWGQQHGYTIVNFLLCYCLGAWYRLNTKWNPNISRVVTGVIVSVLLIYLWYKIENRYFLHTASLVEYNAFSYSNPFVLLISFLALLLFSKWSFKNRIINVLAKASFVCYILHLSILPHLHIEQFARSGGIGLFVHLLLSVVAIYIVSWVAWRILELVLSPFMKKIKNYSIVSIDEK